jgi:hypothetical protein
MAAHNHDLDPRVVAFETRREGVPPEIIKRITEMREDGTSGYNCWRRVQTMYEERNEIAPPLILQDLLALGSDPADRKIVNDAHAALNHLLELQRMDCLGEHEWVVQFR